MIYLYYFVLGLVVIASIVFIPPSIIYVLDYMDYWMGGKKDDNKKPSRFFADFGFAWFGGMIILAGCFGLGVVGWLLNTYLIHW